MGMLKLIGKGSWWLYSKTDSRWNRDGRSNAVGGFQMPLEVTDMIGKITKSLGEEPPDDLEYGCMKD